MFHQKDDKAQCVVCSNVISAVRTYNLSRHYNAHHKCTYGKSKDTEERRSLFVRFCGESVHSSSDEEVRHLTVYRINFTLISTLILCFEEQKYEDTLIFSFLFYITIMFVMISYVI